MKISVILGFSKSIKLPQIAIFMPPNTKQAKPLTQL